MAHEGDKIEIECPKDLAPVDGQVTWFQDGVKVNARNHGRIRYLKKNNTVTVEGISSSDAGSWAVRPRVQHQLPIWCNFTLTVRTDDEDYVEEDLQSDQADEEEAVYHDGAEAAPIFTRLSRMEAAQSIVKPAGSTVTYKCPAEGKFLKHLLYFKNFKILFFEK